MNPIWTKIKITYMNTESKSTKKHSYVHYFSRQAPPIQKQIKFVSENKYALVSLDKNTTSEAASNQLTTNTTNIVKDQPIPVPPPIIASYA